MSGSLGGAIKFNWPFDWQDLGVKLILPQTGGPCAKPQMKLKYWQWSYLFLNDVSDRYMKVFFVQRQN